jgi:SAM-dependent methyltransferase
VLGMAFDLPSPPILPARYRPAFRFLRYAHNLSEPGFWFERALLPPLLAEARRLRPGSIVVDFGCGEAPYKPTFDGTGVRYLGLDVYPGRNVDVVYDGRGIPLESGSVSLLFSASVLEHVEDLDASIAEFARVLAPGGRLLSVVPFFAAQHGTPVDFNRPTEFAWRSKLARAFGEQAEILVSPVCGRAVTLASAATSEMNYLLYDTLRWLARRGREGESRSGTAHSGDASPEFRRRSAVQFAYMLGRLNPLSFVLGAAAALAEFFPRFATPEGRIATGFLIDIRRRQG